MSAVSGSTNNPALISERRQYLRYDVVVPAHIRLRNGYCYEGKTLNIGNGGALLQLADAFAGIDGAPCILTLLPDVDSSDREVKIKCVFKTRQHGSAGLEFRNLLSDEEIQSLIQLSEKPLAEI